MPSVTTGGRDPAADTPDGPGAMALVTAWLNDDARTVADLVSESAADPAPLVLGLGFVATAAIQAYAEAANLPVTEVLRLLGTVTARRLPGPA